MARSGLSRGERVRYAVVGLGHIDQVAVLPAFRHARENSELVALVSDDQEKLEKLGEQYDVAQCVAYDQYEHLLASGDIDAVYIGLPNHLHRYATETAARHGVHVLCEKPIAASSEDARAMIATCEEHGVRLMVAYRLHFEAANLEAVRLATSRIGDPRLFTSTFGFTLQDRDNIRGRAESGGGALLDIGVYCINAARYLFRDEPIEAFAVQARSGLHVVHDDVDETVAATLRFPGDRLAQFTISFAVAPVASYTLVGTSGTVRLDPAYEYAEPIELTAVIDDRETARTYPKRDQFAPELVHFSTCVIEGRDPGPSGREGLADVIVVEALKRSIAEGRPVAVRVDGAGERPTPAQAMSKPPVREPEPVNSESPSG
ncbi:MAG TPA: Gfo/Idh/MocA family oxidoreductase [Planctomycetota bacterium]|nr:Gfo/Idh/MocA family oxidoreductase [Planctomycetota bacterium]